MISLLILKKTLPHKVPFDVEVAGGRPRRDVYLPAYLRDYDCDV